MARFPSVMLGAAWLLAGVAGHALAGDGVDERGDRGQGAKSEILKLEEQVAHAPDEAALASFYAPDVVFFNQTPGRFRSFAAMSADLKKLWGHTNHWKVDILEIQVDVQGPMAVAYSTQHWTGDALASGKPAFDQIFRQTDVWRKKGARWVITHQHVSVPVDFASGKAVCASGAVNCALPPYPAQ